MSFWNLGNLPRHNRERRRFGRQYFTEHWGAAATYKRTLSWVESEAKWAKVKEGQFDFGRGRHSARWAKESGKREKEATGRIQQVGDCWEWVCDEALHWSGRKAKYRAQSKAAERSECAHHGADSAVQGAKGGDECSQGRDHTVEWGLGAVQVG